MADQDPSDSGSNSKDLDLLLDSALDDFDKPLPKVSAPVVPNPPDEQLSDSKAYKVESNQWSDEFKQFQDAMQAFLGSEGKLPKEFEQLSQQVGEQSGSSSISNDFSSSLANTLKTIAENAQSIPEPTPEELSILMNTLGIDENAPLAGSDGIPDFMPMMESMMQNLLSKELLYPALKEMVNKYPDWLREKQSTLDEEQLRKYSSQYEVMKQACQEFERPDAEGSSQHAKESFEKILMLMQKMQEYGNPPKELMGDMPLDPQGNLKLPGMSEQCTLM